MNHENIMLSQVTKGQILYDSTYARNSHTHSETESKKSGVVFARGWGDGYGELVFSGYKYTAWDDKNVWEVDGSDGCTIM